MTQEGKEFLKKHWYEQCKKKFDLHACYSTVIDKEEMWIKETTAQLEKNKIERTWKYWEDLEWGKKKPSATQSGIESDCSSPMLHKERRGLGK